MKPAVQQSVPVKVDQPQAVTAASLAASSVTLPNGSSACSAEIKCSTCSVVCSTNYYHRNEPTKKQSGAPLASQLGAVSICPLCYAEGRFPAELSSVDFVHIDTVSFPSTSTQLKAQPWTDQEILALLDAVDSAGSNPDWDSIAAKIGRSRDQCILQFLRLPTIESLEATVPSDPIKSFPFSNVENPVMSTVAFLASMVHPKVASAAAKAAITALANLRAEESDAMDVDGMAQESLQQIAATAIGAAAARAKVLSSEESNRLSRLRETLIDLQLQKVKAKLQLYEDLEKGLEDDKKDVEQQRLQLFIDRFNLRKMMIKAQANATNGSSQVKQPGVPPENSSLTKL